MATVIKRPMAVASKPALLDGFAVVDIKNIEFMSRAGGGGKPMSSDVKMLIDKALSLRAGQGFKIPASMRLEKPITNSKTQATSTMYTYSGAQSLNKRKKDKVVYRTRRDTANNLWLFRDNDLTDQEIAARDERRETKAADKAAQ